MEKEAERVPFANTLLPIHYSFNSVFLRDTCIGEPVNFCVSFPSSGIGYVHINFHAIL